MPVAKALFNQGITYEQQGYNEAAIESYQQVISYFADNKYPEIQEPVARASVNQGIIYAQQGNNEAAVESYQQVISRFADSEHPETQKVCTFALANSAELLLVNGQYTKAQAMIAQVLERVDCTNQLYAIMPFLRFLIDPSVSCDDVLSAILQLDKDVAFTWGFTIIQPVLATSESNKQAQAKYFIDYFEGWCDKQALQAKIRDAV